jgi:hypothetical protein
MSRAPVFLSVLEVAPSPRGEGLAMTLLWDGGEKALAVGVFDGQEVTAEISPARLLADVHDLQGQACAGRLQVVFRSEALIAQLEAVTAA